MTFDKVPAASAVFLDANSLLVVAVMQARRLSHPASNDADFDRVPWLMRYEPN
jgi:hypothetical protein